MCLLSDREEEQTQHLDNETGKKEVGGGGDVDGGAIRVLSLILQSSKHHHPSPPSLHHVHRALWRTLVAADRPNRPLPRAAELPSGETQNINYLGSLININDNRCVYEDQVLLTEHPGGQCDCRGWGREHRYLPARSRSRKEAMARDKDYFTITILVTLADRYTDYIHTFK